jgi:hypothetical protein
VAQNTKQDSLNLIRELTLEREYNPILEDASKINQLPEIKEPEVPKSKVEFSNYTIPLNIPPYLHTINSSDYLTELLTSKERGYLNLGLSSILNINGDFGYQLLNTNTDYLSLHASNRFSNSNVSYLQGGKKQQMKLNDNYGGFNFRHDFEKARFNADAKYTYSAYNYYGKAIPPISNASSPRDRDISGKTRNQANNMLEVHAGILSKEQSDLYFKINATYTFFQQKYGYLATLKGRRENRFLTDIDLHTYFNSTAGIGFAAYMKNYIYNVPPPPASSNNSEFLLDNFKKYAGNYDYTTFSFNPYFTFEGDNWNSRLGASANIQIGGIKKFIIAPDIHFNWKPTDKSLLYLLLTGGIKDNSNYASYYENRYVDPFFRLYDSKSPLDAVWGVKFSVISNLSIDLFTGYKFVNDEHFYITNFAPTDLSENIILCRQRLVPQYMKAQTFKLGGIFKYVYQDIFDLSLKLTYYKWNVEKLSDNINDYDYYSDFKSIAWNKSRFETDLNLDFQIPVIPLQLDLLYHGEFGRKALLPYNVITDMKDIHDLSFKGTYSIGKTFSVYMAMNNLLFQKYDFWYGYPAQNFNLMGGIGVKF